ncbi:MAG: GNAT family N-acetyltransferase [Coriobacteriia bacterium]|nr:GNAT family N-acetyltransferase [Coriobacteriia bacterium]
MADPFFAQATLADLERLFRPLLASRAFDSRDEVLAVHESEPWRLRVSEAGDVAVLDIWRDHLDILAIEALWCVERTIPTAIEQTVSLAREHGFGTVLSPPVPVDQVHVYERAGMHVRETTATLVFELHNREVVAAPCCEGMTIREGSAGDIVPVLGVDRRCFDDFWRYDERRLRRLVDRQRLAIAECEGIPVGYTLSVPGAEFAQIGRVCVVPEARRQGIGRMLLADVIHAAQHAGARSLGLCTQTGNRASRALYHRVGFRDTGDRFVFLESC